MKNEDKLLDAIIDLSQELKGLRHDMNTRFEKMEKQQANTNLAISELRLSIMKLAEENNKRIFTLEQTVFKKSA